MLCKTTITCHPELAICHAELGSGSQSHMFYEMLNQVQHDVKGGIRHCEDNGILSPWQSLKTMRLLHYVRNDVKNK